MEVTDSDVRLVWRKKDSWRATHLKATYRCWSIAGEVKPSIDRTPHHFRHRIAAVEPHLDLPLVKAAGLGCRGCLLRSSVSRLRLLSYPRNLLIPDSVLLFLRLPGSPN